MSELIRVIGRKEKASLAQKIEGGPIVDKYFFVGALAAIGGVLYFGTHLWLMRSGAVSPWQNYHFLRELHALMQLYLFLGVFVLGFLLQAAPKLFFIRAPISQWGLPLLALLLLSVAIRLISPAWVYGVPLCATFVWVLSVVLAALRSSPREAVIGMGTPFAISLVSFSIGAFLDLGNAYSALFVLWGGAGGAIFGAAQQFVATVLGGSRLTVRSALLSWALFFLSLVFLLLYAAYLSTMYWYLFAWSSAATLVGFSYGSGLHRALCKPRTDSLYLGSLFAWGWALIATIQALVDVTLVDQVLHTWAIGWASTLIIAIVPRIIGFLRGREVIRRWLLTVILLLWQLVAFGRVFDWAAPQVMIWLVPCAAVLSMGSWIVCVLLSTAHLFNHQLKLRRGEKMVQC